MKRKTMIQCIILAVTVLTSVLAFFLLPAQVAVQWNGQGPSSYMSRYAAVLLPVMICAVLVIAWNGRKTAAPDWAMAVFSCLGIAMDILMIVLN